MYYMAMSLSKSGNDEDIAHAVTILEELMSKSPRGLIRIVEDMEDHTVENFVPNIIRKFKEKYSFGFTDEKNETVEPILSFPN